MLPAGRGTSVIFWASLSKILQRHDGGPSARHHPPRCEALQHSSRRYRRTAHTRLRPGSIVSHRIGRFVLTVTGQFVGSLPWASPEQAEGVPGKLDVRTDVYSIG